MTQRDGHRHVGTAGWMAKALVLVLLAVVTPAGQAAEEGEEEGAQTPRLELEAFPYAWISGTYGSVTVGDTTVRLDVTPGDVLDVLFDGDALAAAGYFSVSYGRFSLFADAMGGYADVRVAQTIPTQLCCTLTIDAQDTMKFAIADFALGYRLGEWSLPGRRQPFTLGVYAGARYMYFSNELDAEAGVVGGAQRRANVFESFDWADPLLGVRWSVPVLDPVSLDFRGDVGGFGASSDLVWGLVGTLRWWLPWQPFDATTYLAAGYRVVAFERPSNAGSIDLQFRGPVLGAGGVF